MGTARISITLAVVVACSLGCESKDDEGTNNNPVQNAGSGGAAGTGGSGGTAAEAGSAGMGGEPEAGAGGLTHVDRSMLTDVGVSAPLDYANPGMWACRPDAEPNQCLQDMTATLMNADGTRTVEMHTPAQDAPFDCFYVYPTVLLSGAAQMVDFSDAGIAIVNDPLQTQGARFSRICRMFAPLYRQVGLSGGAPVMGADRALGLQDVRDAFKYYLENWNEGRKFVLIGHSQGTMMLTGMMQMDLDTAETADARARMISALLIGGAVNAPPGEAVGGTFQNIPLCTTQGQAGCVIAYVSYAADSPPTATSIFGHDTADGMQAACVNPAVIAGNMGRYKGSYFRKAIANPSFAPNTPLPEDLATPFAVYRDLFKGECVSRDGTTYLELSIEPTGDTDMRMPPWRNTTVEGIGFGLHLVDYHVPLEDLIDAVQAQAQTAG
jgi:hypothetical protein